MNAINYILILILLVITTVSGCAELPDTKYPDIVVVKTNGKMSLDMEKNPIYNVDLWVRNDGAAEGDANIKIDLLDKRSNSIQDTNNQNIHLIQGEMKQLSFSLKGEKGMSYIYNYYIEATS